jgi:hypothetical protein
MMAEQYRVRVKKGDIEVEVESHEKEFVNQALQEYLRLSGGLTAERTPEAAPGLAISGGKPLSAAESVERVHPENDTEYVLTAAYYLEKQQGMTEFKTTDIKECFDDIGYKHSNPSDAVMRAKNKRYLMKGRAKRTYAVTRSGVDWIEARLKDHEEKA